MQTLRHVAIGVALVCLAGLESSAQQLYITNEGGQSLQLINLKSSQITTLYNIGGKPDDLTLNPQGQLIYSVPAAGTVNLYDPTTGINTVLATGLLYDRDLEMEPSNQSLLIAINPTGKIMRYNFNTDTMTQLAHGLGTCNGIAYDPYGNLYAVARSNTIVQINPVTGAVLNTLVLEPHNGVNGADGLTYDSYTSSLWATHIGTTGYGVIQIPISPTGFTQGNFTYYRSTAFRAPDGIKSDGKGNLYIGAGWTVAVYNISTNSVTKSVVARSADGVSLVPGTY